jgi:hypothetical protein
MRATTHGLIGLSLLALTGCASIVEGSGQNVWVKTETKQPSTCTVSNSRDSSTISGPTQVTVKRSKTDLNVRCVDSATGVQGDKVVASGLENWWWGNIALLSPLGVFIDGVSGAMWEYPKDIVVPLGGQQTSFNQAPATGAPTAYDVDTSAPVAGTAPLDIPPVRMENRADIPQSVDTSAPIAVAPAQDYQPLTPPVGGPVGYQFLPIRGADAAAPSPTSLGSVPAMPPAPVNFAAPAAPTFAPAPMAASGIAPGNPSYMPASATVGGSTSYAPTATTTYRGPGSPFGKASSNAVPVNRAYHAPSSSGFDPYASY